MKDKIYMFNQAGGPDGTEIIGNIFQTVTDWIFANRPAFILAALGIAVCSLMYHWLKTSSDTLFNLPGGGNNHSSSEGKEFKSVFDKWFKPVIIALAVVLVFAIFLYTVLPLVVSEGIKVTDGGGFNNDGGGF